MPVLKDTLTVFQCLVEKIPEFVLFGSQNHVTLHLVTIFNSFRNWNCISQTLIDKATKVITNLAGNIKISQK
ncbi:CLUMA_CG005589, isoform A [Clunio marinus]|uniref:CLUMA_CG005589, isoform A n=1 Tax=Clunio marinus TaxID=568069 RepID=A0A1J1I0V2_9DIPT|nr:CLUMA_CG005589, isoform A [Clunio marinus]